MKRGRPRMKFEMRRAYEGLQGRAHGTVAQAIRAGLLPNPKTLACVDCGSPACGYDHRNYRRPLEVKPVCKSDNSSRGPAEPLWLRNRSVAKARSAAGMTKTQFRALLKRMGLSQSAFAVRLGVSRSAVCRWESGERKIDKFTAEAIRRLEAELVA